MNALLNFQQFAMKVILVCFADVVDDGFEAESIKVSSLERSGVLEDFEQRKNKIGIHAKTRQLFKRIQQFVHPAHIVTDKHLLQLFVGGWDHYTHIPLVRKPARCPESNFQKMTFVRLPIAPAANSPFLRYLVMTLSNHVAMADQKHFAQRLYRYLEQAELILMVILGASLVARYMQVNGHMTGLQISLSGLAGIYFLMAYRPPTPVPATEKKGFAALLLQTILPKVLWIGCAVGAIGIMFHLLQLEGARELLVIHAASGGVGVGMFLAFRQTNDSHTLTPVLYRAVPFLLISVYLLTAL
jgi:hypothetical protein